MTLKTNQDRGGPVRSAMTGRAARSGVAVAMLGLIGALFVSVVLPAQAASASFVSLASPARVLDTRPGRATADHRYQGVGALTSGRTIALPLAGRVGVPSGGVGAIVLNVTAAAPTLGGFVTAYPCGATRPTASSLNLVVGQTAANAVIARPGSGGAVCFYALGTTDLVVDVTGWFPTGAVTPLSRPVRLLDTRTSASSGSTVDGRQIRHGAVNYRTEIAVPIAGRGGLPSTPTAVVLNLTVVSARSAGYLSVYPCGSTRPNSSSINFAAGATRANAVVTGLSSSGTVCIYSGGTADVVLDASASLPAASYTALTPARLLDTRVKPTVDGLFSGTGRQPAGASLTLPVAGRGSVPPGAKAVVLNVTAVEPTTGGYTTVFPQGAMPNASSLNYGPGQVVANLVVAPLSANGSACLTTNLSTTDLVVDVAGYLTTGVTPGAAPCPALAVSDSPDAVRDRLVYRAPLQKVVGTDKIGVVVCAVPSDYPGYDGDPTWTPITGVDLSAATVASWANGHVAPYFSNVSGGKYLPTFVPLGTATLQTADASDVGGPDDCLAAAQAMASGSTYTNVLATDDRHVDLGFASPGGIPTTAAVNPTVLTSGPPSSSHRGLYLGGDVVFTHPNKAIAAHEIGHTIHWPHSYMSDDEYDNPTDLMSGSPGSPSSGWCSTGDLYAYACAPQSALAFDRMAAGWMTSRQSVIHGGVANYALDAANGTLTNAGGTQLVAVADAADPYSFLTLEGRAATGYDSLFTGSYCHPIPDTAPDADPGATVCDPSLPTAHDGVVVSLVRQTQSVDGISLGRRQSQAFGRPYSFDHVLQVGDTQEVDGVTISVLARSGSVFTVQVQGSYHTPAGMRTVAATALTTPSTASVVVPTSSPEGARH